MNCTNCRINSNWKSTFQHAWSRFASEEKRLKWAIPAYNVQWLAAYRQIPHCTKNKGGGLLIHLFSSLLLGTSMPGADTVTYCHWKFIFYKYVPCHICPGCNNSSFRRSLVSSNLDRKTMQIMNNVITREQKKQDCTVLSASSQKLSHKKQSNSLMRQTALPPDVGGRGTWKEAAYLNNLFKAKINMKIFSCEYLPSMTTTAVIPHGWMSIRYWVWSTTRRLSKQKILKHMSWITQLENVTEQSKN